MAAGHIVHNSCVDVAASLDAYYSTLQPASSPGALTHYSIASKGVSGWELLTFEGSTLISQAALPVPNFPSCDTTAPFFDGLQLGWAVVAAMAVAWALTVIRRGL